VLPGEAFCDECGASLSAAAPTVIPGVSNDAPTMFAPPLPSANAAAPADGEQTVICAACGQPNLATDRFCDHCGAALAAPADAAVPPTTDVPTVLPDALPATNGTSPEEVASNIDVASIPPAEAAQAEAPTVEQPALPVPSADAQATYEAEQQRLGEEIARQQQIISQLEPVQMALGAATPAGVAQSIEQARDAKAKAEADLAALTSGVPAQVAPAVAPAEAAPELPAVPVNIAPAETPAPPTPTPLETAVSEPAREAAPLPVPSVTATPTPAPTAAAAPRLVMDEGNDLPLPTDKPEIIVGREDPISGIFPEIDLTPYGGETGGVSRQHARLNYSAGQWTVTDLNSTNYTRVDGAKIEPNVATRLQDGARLQFGRVAMTFKN